MKIKRQHYYQKFQYLPKTKQEDVAVNMLDAVTNNAWSNSNLLLMIAPTDIANTETINAATVACTCTNAILPTIMWVISLNEDKLPKFAWVDSL